MSKIYVMSAMDPGYDAKQERFGYLRGLDRMEGVERVFFLIGWPDSGAERLAKIYPRVKFVRLESSSVRAPNPNGCVQHGGFLEAGLGFDPDDFLIFTDCDMAVQRSFTGEERAVLLSGLVLAAANWSDGETLMDETRALGLTAPEFVLERMFPGCSGMRCLNTGVLGMTARDWERMYRLYRLDYPLVASAMSHYARQQWLLCYLLQSRGFQIHDPASQFVRTVHAHGHEPCRSDRLAAQRVERTGRAWRCGGVPVVFAHNLLEG